MCRCLAWHKENSAIRWAKYHFVAFRRVVLCPKDAKQTEVQLQQALKLSQQLGDKYNEANALARLSQVYAARNEPQKSLEYNFKSLEKGKEFYDVLPQQLRPNGKRLRQ